jgi:hypothetical protein
MTEVIRKETDDWVFELSRDNTLRKELEPGEYVEVRNRPAAGGHAVVARIGNCVQVCRNVNMGGETSKVETAIVDKKDVSSFQGSLRALARLKSARDELKGIR